MTKSPLPAITIVTPNFNRADFLRDTIESVLSCRYPNLDYRVYDACSTDKSLDILYEYKDRLHCVSEPDDGPYSSIVRGFEEGRGEILAWINSDDIYLPWTLQTVGEIFRDCPEINWLTSSIPVVIRGSGAALGAVQTGPISSEAFLNGEFNPTGDWFSQGWIQQESTFWRRNLWQNGGRTVLTKYAYGGDFALWAKFFEKSDLVSVCAPLAAFRAHGNQQRSGSGRYLPEVNQAFIEAKGKVPSKAYQRLRKLFLPRRNGRIGLLGKHLNILHPCRKVTWSENLNRWVTEETLG